MRRLALALVVSVLMAGCTAGAATLARPSDAPIRFVAGPDAAEPVVAALSFGELRTSLDVALRGAAGTTTVADALVKMQDVDGKPHLVLVRATPAADDRVPRFSFTFRDARGEPRGTLDLRAPVPAVELRIGSGETLDAQLVLGVGDGATGGITTMGVTVLE